MPQKLSILFMALIALSACTSNINEAERLGKCVVDGNANNNCELTTLEYGQDKK